MQNGCTALYVASQDDHAEVVDILLLSGADPNLATTVWQTFSMRVYTPCSYVLPLKNLTAPSAQVTNDAWYSSALASGL